MILICLCVRDIHCLLWYGTFLETLLEDVYNRSGIHICPIHIQSVSKDSLLLSLLSFGHGSTFLLQLFGAFPSHMTSFGTDVACTGGPLLSVR